MPTAKLVNMAGQQIGEYELSEAVFGLAGKRPTAVDFVTTLFLIAPV